MPKNTCKCCPVVKRNFRDHYTCHKSRPSVRKYGSFLNRYYENDSPFENTKKYDVCYTLLLQLRNKEVLKKHLKKFNNNSTHQKSKIYQKKRDV